MIPKWGWPVGVAIDAVCFEVNRGGFGWISFIAAGVFCRLIVTGREKGESEQVRWVEAFGVALVGFIGYSLIATMLHPGEAVHDGGGYSDQ